MNQTEFLDDCATKLRDHVNRVEVATSNLSDDQLSRDLASGEWGVGRVIEHLNLSNEPYLSGMRSGLATAPGTPGGVAQTGFWGRTIAKFAGPDKDAPVPADMVPASATYTREVVDQWKAVMGEIIALADEAKAKDINQAKFKNPFVKFMKMNVVDGYTIIVAHTERHVRQIEARSKLVILAD